MIVTLAAAAVLAAALWAFGVLFGLVNAQLVGEILVGLALAPAVAATGLDASLVTTVKVLGEIGLVMIWASLIGRHLIPITCDLLCLINLLLKPKLFF
jgi:hypothetical protein